MILARMMLLCLVDGGGSGAGISVGVGMSGSAVAATMTVALSVGSSSLKVLSVKMLCWFRGLEMKKTEGIELRMSLMWFGCDRINSNYRWVKRQIVWCTLKTIKCSNDEMFQ